MVFYEYEKYYIAHDAIMVLTFIPTVVILFCSLCMARRRGDPARSAFTWLKPAFAIFTLFIFLDVCAYGLGLAAARLQHDYDLSSYYSNSASLIRNIEYASTQTFLVARLVEAFGDLLIFITLVSLGTGILIALNGSVNGMGKALKFASFGIAAVLSILTVAQFGLRTDVYRSIFDSNSVGITVILAKHFNSSRQIDFAFRVLIFVLALGVVGYSIMVKMQTRTEPRLSTPSLTYIACAGVWLLRTVYGMAAMAATVNLSDLFDDPVYHNYYDILDIVFAVWPQLILLSLVFGLGCKKLNGLWSTDQPHMTNQGTAVSPWGYNYNPNQVPVQNMVPPQAPPMQQQQVWPQYQQQQQVPYYAPVDQNKMQFQQQPIAQYPLQQPQQQVPAPQSYTSPSPVSNTRSPPPHEEVMGYNHQANGSPPQVAPQPYYPKQ